MSVLDITIDGLPRRPRGRPPAARELEYREQVDAFCKPIKKIRSSMNFAVGSRGWCYILENRGVIRKGDFEKLITNALVVAPEIGRQLCRDAILERLPADAVDCYAHKLDRARKCLHQAICRRVV